MKYNEKVKKKVNVGKSIMKPEKKKWTKTVKNGRKRKKKKKKKEEGGGVQSRNEGKKYLINPSERMTLF